MPDSDEQPVLSGAFALMGAKADERETLLDLLVAERTSSPPGPDRPDRATRTTSAAHAAAARYLPYK